MKKKVKKSAAGLLLLTVKRWDKTILSLALAPSRGEFDFDLGADGAHVLLKKYLF